MLQTTERSSLAVCGSLCREKQFFLALSKKVVYTNPNFPQYLPISNMLRKTNFLSISVLVSGHFYV